LVTGVSGGASKRLMSKQVLKDTKKARRRVLNTAIAKLRAFLDGPPLNVVN
jgi:hypothetical protein